MNSLEMKHLKNIPLRKCIGCGQKNRKEEFIIILRPPKSDLFSKISILHGKNKSGGRCAYICKNESCLKKAKKSRRIEKIFSGKADKNIYDEIEKEINIYGKQ